MSMHFKAQSISVRRQCMMSQNTVFIIIEAITHIKQPQIQMIYLIQYLLYYIMRRNTIKLLNIAIDFLFRALYNYF